MASILDEIVIDCADPRRVAEFWGAVLGWTPQAYEDYFWMSETGDVHDRGMVLVFVPVPEPKTVKNRVHIDVRPSGGATQAEEVERLIGLGARHIDIGQGEVPWVVLADVEDNEFCVLGARPTEAG
jgi:Glyoxalase-like domain